MLSIVVCGLLESARTREEYSQAFARQHTAAQRKRDPVADKGIDEGGGIPDLEDSILYGFGLAENQRRRAYRLGKSLPTSASLIERGM